MAKAAFFTTWAVAKAALWAWTTVAVKARAISATEATFATWATLVVEARTLAPFTAGATVIARA
ncbi:hypothetical protein D3C72_2294680 [compost metagenome]